MSNIIEFPTHRVAKEEYSTMTEGSINSFLDWLDQILSVYDDKRYHTSTKFVCRYKGDVLIGYSGYIHDGMTGKFAF